MRNLIYFIIPFLIMGCQITTTDKNNQEDTKAQSEEEVKKEVKDGIFIHISSGPEYNHKVLMALKMANIMAEEKDVLVYFDIDGVHVPLKEAVEITHDGFPSAQEQLQSLIDKGVTIFVCPTCLDVEGKTPKDLMKGVILADKEKFFSFTEGRILTIDY